VAMSKHTPTPWRENSQGDTEYIFSEIHGAIATIAHGGLQRDEHKANAKRIVACVNACHNIPDEHLANAAENTRIIIGNAKAMEELLREVIEFDRISNGRLPIPLSTIAKIKAYISS